MGTKDYIPTAEENMGNWSAFTFTWKLSAFPFFHCVIILNLSVHHILAHNLLGWWLVKMTSVSVCFQVLISPTFTMRDLLDTALLTESFQDLGYVSVLSANL